MMPKDELLPCPCCGSDANIATMWDDRSFKAYCRNIADCALSQQVWFDTLQEAINAWNRRTVEPGMYQVRSEEK